VTTKRCPQRTASSQMVPRRANTCASSTRPHISSGLRSQNGVRTSGTPLRESIATSARNQYRLATPHGESENSDERLDHFNRLAAALPPTWDEVDNWFVVEIAGHRAVTFMEKDDGISACPIPSNWWLA
jgi:hypothetical protein